jgi:hypothetical protein
MGGRYPIWFWLAVVAIAALIGSELGMLGRRLLELQP